MDRRYVPLSIGLVLCTMIAAGAWVGVKLSRQTSIDVRGSAKRRIASDVAQWTASISSVKPTRVEAYSSLRKDVETAVASLLQSGLAKESVRESAATLREVTHEEVIETPGHAAHRKTVSDGYEAQQNLDVTSNDIALVERLSRESTKLLEKGIAFTSMSPRYLFTKVADVKIEMLAEASKDARLRAEKMLAAAGSGATVGRVAAIDTGVININAANSTETSWEGNSDTSSYEKDIITTVRVRFEIKD